MQVGARWIAAWSLALACSLAARAEHPDVSWLVYTGAGSCASPCHVNGSWTMEATARQFTHSAHFQLKAPVPAQTIFHPGGGAVTGSHGMLNRLDSLPGTLSILDWLGLRQLDNPATPGGEAAGCARCHASTGRVAPAQLNEEAWHSVDCLICHSLDYRVGGQPLTNAAARRPVADATSPTGWRLPLPAGADLGAASRSIVAHPTTQACQRCHLHADNGYLHRTGADNATDDLHAQTLSCFVCHASENHRFAAGRPKPTQWAVERFGTQAGNQVTCAGCHSLVGQAARPDLNIVVPAHSGVPLIHFTWLACESCHIPEVRGLEWQAFDRLERVVENGRFKRWQPRSGVGLTPRAPEYRWYDGTVWTDDQPRGAFRTYLHRIAPFRRVQSRVPQDMASNRLLPLDLAILGDADSLMTNFVQLPLDTLGLLDRAVRQGVAAAAAQDPASWSGLVNAQGHYTGQWRMIDRQMMFPVNHGARRPAERVLSCLDCHIIGTRLDWTALGYSGDPYYGTAVDTQPGPADFWLGPCRPNPFNNSTIVPFQLGGPAVVDLAVHDLQGRQVLSVLAARPMNAGRHEVQIAADRLPSGVYLYRLRADGRERAGKMLLVK
ncbi:MAG: T9SS type A sorting domain-containing protein [bacterium]|nr:T9SS type A sorting domain-containing protein [bacterium]